MATEPRLKTFHRDTGRRRCGCSHQLLLSVLCSTARGEQIPCQANATTIELTFFFEQCSPRLFILNLLLIAMSLLGLVASASTAAFSANIYGKTGSGRRETIQSWTCLWYDGAKASGTASHSTSSSLSAPAGFSRACLESHAAFDLLVVALVLEVGVVGLSVAGYWIERKLG